MIEETETHVEGPAWNTASRYKTFEEADAKRRELTADEDLEVKVKWMRKRDDFVVKTRISQSAVKAQEAQRRREEKKRRKAKLSKKRRKK